ncbi:MAG: porin family protein [Mangrovibacterium sp.]
MKRILTLSVLLLVIPFAYGQSPLNIGLKAGYTTSELKTNLEQFNDGSINNFLVGAFARVNLNSIYIQPEVYFTSKGGKLSDVSRTESFNMDCVDVPVLLGVKLLKLPTFNIRLNAGPVFSFVTKVDNSQLESIDSERFENNYVGIQYGAGVDFLFMSLDARMENSLSDIQKNIDGDLKSNIFMVTLGFKIL